MNGRPGAAEIESEASTSTARLAWTVLADRESTLRTSDEAVKQLNLF
jgi:hypothetical protein